MIIHIKDGVINYYDDPQDMRGIPAEVVEELVLIPNLPQGFTIRRNEFIFNDLACADEFCIAHEEGHSLLGHCDIDVNDLKSATKLEIAADMFAVSKLGKSKVIESLTKYVNLIIAILPNAIDAIKMMNTRIHYIKMYA